MKLSVFIVAIALGLFALWRWNAAAQEPAVANIALQQGVISTIDQVVDATGVIKPRNGSEVRVGARISGVLQKLHVDVGSQVSAGQLLAELDAAELKTRLKQEQARVVELQMQFDWSEQVLARNAKLSVIAAIELDTLKKEVALNKARLQQAQAEYESEQVRESWTRITAPIAGTVASVSTRQGETVAASLAAPTFLTIIDLTRLEIQAYVDEADIGHVQAGQQVQFSVDTWPGTRFNGVVSTIYPAATLINNVVNYIAVITFEAPASTPLRPEMTAHVQFVLQHVEAALTVPRAALFSKGGNYFVLVADGEHWLQRPVTLGIVNAAAVQISTGLQQSEKFVSDYQAWLAARAAGGK